MEQKQKYEDRLLSNVRVMTDKDRQWILALSDQCVEKRKRVAEEVIIATRYSLPTGK